MKIKIGVISDIHANADALMLVMEGLKLKEVDKVVCLGDILTYGCQPLEVIDILHEYKKENSIIFVKGNHDQFYFDLQRGNNKFSYKLPEFVEESVNWTLKKINSFSLESAFPWLENYYIGNTYFSHANPFRYGNWSYLEEDKDLTKALKSLEDKNFFSGVFGHSHRQLFVARNGDDVYEISEYTSEDNKIDQLIINTGSVGQPRGKGVGYVILEIKDGELFKADFHKLKVNFDNSLDLISGANFKQETSEKLINYLQR